MNPQQQAFCDFYVTSGNAQESYKRAYTNCKTDLAAKTRASKLLNKDEIVQYLNTLMDVKSNERIATGDEVLQYLTAAMRSDEVGPRDRIKAAELLGKRYRLFVDRVEAEVQAVVEFIGENELED